MPLGAVIRDTVPGEHLDTALPAPVQERVEQTLRDVLAGLTPTAAENRREMPPPGHDRLALDRAPELDALSFASPPDRHVVTAALYFTGRPDGETALVPGDLSDPAYEFPARATDRAPTHLGALGGGYAALADAVTETLSTYCDAPSYAPHLAFLGGEADLVCTSCYGEVITFACHVEYPEYIASAYGEGREDVAREYGLPY
jgi:hypothetical protein